LSRQNGRKISFQLAKFYEIMIKDPFMLLSMVNMKLRDQYDSLDELCAGEDLDKEELVSRLHDAGFDYVTENNQFK